MPLPFFYSFRRCPFAMRARLALAVGSQQCELREIALKNKPAELLAAWPGGTVPVLVYAPESGLEPLVHSLDIMLWALAQNDPAHWLQPGRGNLALMCKWIGEFDSHFKPLLDRYKYPNRYATEWANGQQTTAVASPAPTPATTPAAIPAPAQSAAAFAHHHRQQGAALLANLEALLHLQSLQGQHSLETAEKGAINAKGANDAGSALHTKPWLFGNRPSLADMAVLPFVRQFADTDRLWFDRYPAWPQLVQWLQAWEQSALFALIMQKYPLWQPGSSNRIVFPGAASAQ